MKRLLLRVLAGIAALLLGLLGLVCAMYLVVSGTDWGRERVRRIAVAQLEPLFVGRIAVGEISRLGLGGIGLRQLSVSDPAGKEVLALRALELAVSPAALLGGELDIERVELRDGRIDLADLSSERGLLAAFALKSPQPEPPQQEAGRPLRVRVRAIAVDGLAASAEIAGFGVAGVSDLSLRASYAQNDAIDATLERLSAALSRDTRPIGRIHSAAGRYLSAGGPSALQLTAQVAQTRLRLDAKAQLPGEPAIEDAPLQLELQLERLEAATFAALGRAEWGAPLRQALDLRVVASGSARAPRAAFELSSSAGSVTGDVALSAEQQLRLNVSARQIALAQLYTGLPAGVLDGTLSAEADHIRSKEIPLRLRFTRGRWDQIALPGATAAARWYGSGLRDLSLELLGYDGRFRLDGAVDFDGDAQARLELALPRLEQLPRVPGVPPARGALELRSELALQQGRLRVQGTLAVRAVQLPQATVAASDVSFEVTGDLLAPRLRTTLSATGVRAGSLRLDGATLRLDARSTHDALVASLSAAGQLQGEPFRLSVERARIAPEASSLELRGAQASAFGQRVTLSGRYGEGRVDGLVLEAHGIDLERLRTAFDLQPALAGTADLHATARGTAQAPIVALSLRGRELRLGQGPALGLVADAELDTRQGRARVEARAESSAGRSLTLQATADFAADPRASWAQRLGSARLAAEAAIEQLDSADLSAWLGQPLPVDGTGSLRLHLQGPLSEPELESELHARLRQLAPGRDADLQLQASYARGEARLAFALTDRDGPWLDSRAHLSHPERSTQALLRDAAQLLQRAAWDAQLEVHERSLGAAPQPAALPAPAASLVLAAQLSASHAPAAPPKAELKLQLRHPGEASSTDCRSLQAELAVRARLEEGQLRGQIELSRRAQQLAVITARSALDLAPSLALQGPPLLAGLELDAALDELDLAELPLVCGRVMGKISGSARARAVLESAPELTLALKARGLSLDRLSFMDATLGAELNPVLARLDLALLHGATRSTLKARVPLELRAGQLGVSLDQPLSAELELDRLPVGALIPPGSAVSRASGTLSGRIALGGTRAAPELRGHLAPENVGFTATALAQPLSDIGGRIVIDRDRIDIQQLGARDGDGTLLLDGRLDLRPLAKAAEANLTLVAKKFPLRQQGRVSGTLDASLRAHAALDEREARVAVQLEDASLWLRSGDLRQGIDLDAHPDVIDPRAPSARPGVPPPPAGPALPLELSIEARDSFWVRREDFAVRLSAQLTASSKQGQLRLRGPVILRRGYLQLLGKVFELQGPSRLEFVGGDPPDPVLDIQAQARNRGQSQVVGVKITGRARAPVLEFTIDGQTASAVAAAEALFASGASSGSAKDEARSFVSGLSSGLLALSARSELGEMMPILLVEPGGQGSASRVRAGFELDSLVPSFLAGVIRGVYVEGIIASGGGQQQQDTGGGVLLELYLPHDLVTAGQYGPGETWSLDLGWEP